MKPVTRQIIEHVLDQIRATTGLDESKVKIYDGIKPDIRTPEDADRFLPMIVVLPVTDRPHEDGGADSEGGVTRVLSYSVMILVASANEADTDDLAVLVRAAVLGDLSAGGHALDTEWDTQEWADGETAEPTVATKLNFSTSYRWSPEW